MNDVRVDPAARRAHGRRRRGLGRRRPRDAGARPRDDRRPRLDHRRRRLHARRRHRLADAQVRPRLRQPRRRPTSSPPTAGSSTRARRRTPTCSGACAAAAATSASSRSSSSSCTRSGRWSTPGRSSTRPTRPASCCARSATGRPTRPDEITALVNLTTAPPLPVIPEEWHGKKVAAFIAASSRPDRGGRGARRRVPRRSPSRSPTCSGRCRTTAIQTLIDPLWPKGIHAYFKATNLARLDDELIDRLCELHLAAPGPQCEIHVHQMGGAVARVAEGATAFAERSMPFVLNAVTGWHDPGRRRAHTRVGARRDRRGAPTRRPAARTSTSSATRTRHGRPTATRRTPGSSR